MKGKIMNNKYDRIDDLYKNRSEITLAICTLESRIVRSNNPEEKLQLLRELRDFHYQEFMSEFEIKAVIEEPDRRPMWKKLLDQL